MAAAQWNGQPARLARQLQTVYSALGWRNSSSLVVPIVNVNVFSTILTRILSVEISSFAALMTVITPLYANGWTIAWGSWHFRTA